MTDKKKYIERIPAGQALKGKVLFRDKTRDLALVQLDRLPPGRPAHPAGQEEPPRRRDRHQHRQPREGRPDVQHDRREGPGGRDRGHGRPRGRRDPADQGQDGDGHQPGQPGRLRRARSSTSAATRWRSPRAATRGAAAQNVNSCVDVTEVRAFLAEKKITIKELSDEPDAADVAAEGRAGGHRPEEGRAHHHAEEGRRGRRDAAGDEDRPGPGPGPAAGPTAEDEKAAARLLSRANLFAEGDDNRPTYVDKLKEVDRQVPGDGGGQGRQEETGRTEVTAARGRNPRDWNESTSRRRRADARRLF